MIAIHCGCAARTPSSAGTWTKRAPLQTGAERQPAALAWSAARTESCKFLARAGACGQNRWRRIPGSQGIDETDVTAISAALPPQASIVSCVNRRLASRTAICRRASLRLLWVALVGRGARLRPQRRVERGSMAIGRGLSGRSSAGDERSPRARNGHMVTVWSPARGRVTCASYGDGRQGGSVRHPRTLGRMAARAQAHGSEAGAVSVRAGAAAGLSTRSAQGFL